MVFRPVAGRGSGDPANEIRAEVKSIIKQLYPCNDGCVIVPNMIPMGTPAENIHAMVQALEDFGKYPIDLDRLNSDD